MKEKAIIVDIDGTLAFVGDRSYFDASKAHLTDKPNKPVVTLVQNYFDLGYRIIFVTGRYGHNGGFTSTVKQLESYFPIRKYDSGDFDLYMRTDGDFRPDTELKGEIYNDSIVNKFDVEFVLEDRNSMVRYYRKTLGLTCFQVNYDTGTGKRKKKEGLDLLKEWVKEYGQEFTKEEFEKNLKL